MIQRTWSYLRLGSYSKGFNLLSLISLCEEIGVIDQTSKVSDNLAKNGSSSEIRTADFEPAMDVTLLGTIG